MKKVLVYVGEGAGPKSVRHLIKTLRDEGIDQSFQITRIDRHFLKQKAWEEETMLLVFPGGRDIYYHQALRGKPNARIHSYVRNGGKYLGLCAGGYYGCGSIEFEKGYPLEVIGDRELGFFPGQAKGAAYGPNMFSYEDESGARAAKIEWLGNETGFRFSSIYFNGGCEFINADNNPNTTVLARYHDIPHTPAAIVQCEVGKGRAILSGVHPEYSACHLTNLKATVPQLLFRLQKSEHYRKKLFLNVLKRLLPIS